MPMQPHQVDPALGEEPGMMRQVVWAAVVLDAGRQRPKADRGIIAADEAVPIGLEADEPMLAGFLLVEVAEVEQGILPEGVALGAEGPGLRLSPPPRGLPRRRACRGQQDDENDGSAVG